MYDVLRLLLAVLFLGTAPAVASATGPLPVVRPSIACPALTDLDLTAIAGPGSHVRSAKETTVNGIAVCAVEGVLAPNIGFRMQLPLHSWTQRYLQLGCGGFCGNAESGAFVVDGCAPLSEGGFATATTDMGHQTSGGAFGLDPQQRVDFAYRGVHLTALAAKKLIAAFYQQAPAFSYFSGCSDGGREALMEAQRYPDEFDGILAGAPSLIFVVQNGLYHPWQARANLDANGQPILLAEKLPLLHGAVLNQCDGLDGQVDGVLSDPRLCNVNLQKLLCKAGDAPAACLSAAEIAAVQRLYDGPRDSHTGERLSLGGPMPGSELAWAGQYVPYDAQHPSRSQLVAQEALSSVVFEPNPAKDFRLADLRFERATLERLRVTHPLYDASNPDLSAFANAGNKLLLWHGWADQNITPLNSITYYDALQRQMGSAQAQAFSRLYMLPGLYHCAGGEGLVRVDMLTPLMNWVERGQSPDAIVTSDDKGASRPVFPYPVLATYNGQGDPKQASSYHPGAALVNPTPVPWLGEDLFRPYSPRVR